MEAGVAGLDKKTLNCFPDLEKVAVPSSLVPKAGVSIQKRLSKLVAFHTDITKLLEKQDKLKRQKQVSFESSLMEQILGPMSNLTC